MSQRFRTPSDSEDDSSSNRSEARDSISDVFPTSHLPSYSDSEEYDTDESSPSISSSLLESLTEDIERDEQRFDQHPLQHRQRCIGMYLIHRQENTPTQFLFIIRISAETFYKYPVDDLENYLTDFYAFSISPEETIIIPNLDILQIHHDYSHSHFESPTSVSMSVSIEPSYQVIVKTLWIKWIQREWRKRLQQCLEKTELIIQQRGLPSNQYYFQTRGRYPPGLNQFPQPRLKGLMYQYSSPSPSHRNSHQD